MCATASTSSNRDARNSCARRIVGTGQMSANTYPMTNSAPMVAANTALVRITRRNAGNDKLNPASASSNANRGTSGFPCRHQ